LLNIALSNGGAFIPEEMARYDINKKLTTVDVEGSEKMGFLYNVTWFDNTFIHELECTQKIYDATIVDHMITWAKKHDQ
jgi:hypothetical protein